MPGAPQGGPGDEVGILQHREDDIWSEVRVGLYDPAIDETVAYWYQDDGLVYGELDVYYAGDSCYMEKALSQRSTWYRLLPRFKSFYKAERAVFDKSATTEILTISNVEVPSYRQHYRTPAERFHPLPDYG